MNQGEHTSKCTNVGLHASQLVHEEHVMSHVFCLCLRPIQPVNQTFLLVCFYAGFGHISLVMVWNEFTRVKNHQYAYLLRSGSEHPSPIVSICWLTMTNMTNDKSGKKMSIT